MHKASGKFGVLAQRRVQQSDRLLPTPVAPQRDAARVERFRRRAERIPIKSRVALLSRRRARARQGNRSSHRFLFQGVASRRGGPFRGAYPPGK